MDDHNFKRKKVDDQWTTKIFPEKNGRLMDDHNFQRKKMDDHKNSQKKSGRP